MRMYQMFPSMLCRRNLKTKQSPVSLDLCLRKTQVGTDHMIIIVAPVPEASFSNCFPFSLKHNAGVFNFLHFKEFFRKLVTD